MANFVEVIKKSVVCLNLVDQDRQQLVTTLIEAAVTHGVLSPAHKDEAVCAIMKREMSASTAMPDGIALPHGRTDCVTDLICVIGIHPQGIDFDAPDKQPSHIFVLLLVPTTVACNHIHFLANLSRRLMEQSVRNDLLAAQTRKCVLQAILSESDEGSF